MPKACERCQARGFSSQIARGSDGTIWCLIHGESTTLPRTPTPEEQRQRRDRYVIREFVYREEDFMFEEEEEEDED